MKAAILVAIEKYAGPNLPHRPYAAADAAALADLLQPLGFSAANSELLLNEQATKSACESVLRTTLKHLTEEDTLCLFYSGHSFSDPTGGYLTCCDTRLADPEETSIRLHSLLQQLAASRAGKILLFLDSSSSGLLANAEFRRSYGSLDAAELSTTLEKQPQSVCFTACLPDETSHTRSDLKRGIWASHLAEALSGQIPATLVGAQLTASALQRHLEGSVAATLRITAPSARQSPQCYGAPRGDFLVADLAELLAARESAQHPHAAQVKDSILLVETSVSIKSLAGFKKKGHHIPDRHNESARSFIRELADNDLKSEIERLRGALKAQFRFTRLQLSADLHPGAATITTPFFNYNVSLNQDPADPGCVLWRRSLEAITQPEKVLSPEFEAVFPDLFDTVELSLASPVDLEGLVDCLEALPGGGIAVDYPADGPITECTLAIPGHNAEIRVEKTKFTVIQPRAGRPRKLLELLFGIQHALTQQHGVDLIPFGGG